MKISQLKELYSKLRFDIKKRIAEFEKLRNASDERIFAELAFCLCTPQSKATVCWRAIERLYNSGKLFTGSYQEILKFLEGIRFKENKAKYILLARKQFSKNGKIVIKNKLNLGNEYYLREYFANNVKGLGFKESSHFLRNVGIAKQLAILDVHILKSLHELKVISQIPKSLSKKKYLEIEKAMQQFSRKIGIPMRELDLLLWASKTGFVFK